MPPPQTWYPSSSASTTSLYPKSKVMYWAACSRVMSIVLALMFIPMVAQPLGITDLIIAMLAGVTISVLWDIFAVAYRLLTQQCLPWPLLITFDLIIIPTTLLVFGASAYMDGITPRMTAPDEHQRVIMALVLFILVSLFHLTSISCDLKTIMNKRRPRLTTPTRRHRCITPTRNVHVPQSTVERQPPRTINDVEDLFGITQPENALTKQRADEPSRRLSDEGRSESLPLYNLVDPAGAVPPYDARSTK